MSMRAVLTSAILALVTVALTASAALVVLTTALHRNVTRLGAAIESVQLGEQLHELLGDPGDVERLAAPAGAGGLAWRVRTIEEVLDRARAIVVGKDGEEVFEAARRNVEAFLDAARVASPAGGEPATRVAYERAREALQAYSDWNLAFAQAEKRWADRWDEVARAWGLASAALLVAAGALLVALRGRLLSPLLEVAAAIPRVGHGDRGVRVSERGPAEMRAIARSFNEMTTRLERQQEERLAFLAGVAHDLRNPLSAIRIATHAVAQQSLDPSRLRSVLETVQRQVMRIDRMASDFLDASRVEAGQIELVLEDRDLRDVARAALELYGPATPSHLIALHVPDLPVVVRCDPARLEQVANNLVSNAIKYSPDGGRIDLRVERVGDRAVLAIEDEGVGIASEDLATIFQPFRRGARLREAVPGLGLGLAMSRRIVERHGGRIEVASEPRRGTTFRVTLPLSPSPVQSATEGPGGA